jgi:hypothetical protein
MYEKKKNRRDRDKQRGEDFSLPEQNRHSGNNDDEGKNPEYQEKAALAILTPISLKPLNDVIGVAAYRG